MGQGNDNLAGTYRVAGTRPLQEPFRGPGVHDPVRVEAEVLGPGAAVDLEVELPGGVRVGVDGEQAADLDREPEQSGRRVASLGPGVDLDRDVVLGAGLEHRARIELRLATSATVAGDQSTGAVPEHVGERVVHRLDHPPGHRRAVHRQLGVHRGHPDVELGEHLVGLVELAVVEDVDLDSLEQPEPARRPRGAH